MGSPTSLFLLGLLAATLSARELGPPAPSAREKCPVCGMFVTNFPDWLGALRFKDGTWAYFDGPKDLFSYLTRPGKSRPGRNPADAVSILVKDYYGLNFIDARAATFVLGSNVMGPMGRELVPFVKEADAKAFLKDHGGQRLLRFPEVTPEILKGLE